MASLAGETKTSDNSLCPVTVDLNLELYKPLSEEDETGMQTYYETYPEHKDTVQPGKVLRFLRARKHVLDQANEMLNNHIKWEEKVQPNSITLEECDDKAMGSGCWRYLGQSKIGYPIAWVQTKYWNPHEYGADAYVIYVAYFSAMMERLMKENTKQIIIFDMSGWAFWHARYMSYIKKLIDIAQNQYPERLGRVLMVNSPFLFRASWAVIRPWMDPVTTSKVFFVSGLEEIEKTFDELGVPKEYLPVRYGGLVEDEDSIPVPGFPTTLGKEKELQEDTGDKKE